MGLFGPPDVKKMEAKRDINGLIKALREPYVGSEAAFALGRLRDPRAVEPLIKALGDYRVRDAAAFVLAELGDRRAVEPLISLAQEYNKDAFCAAADALGKFGDVRAVEPIISNIRKGQSEKVLLAAISALVALGDARAIAPLIDMLNDDDYPHSDAPKAAMDALVKIGASAVKPLIMVFKNCTNEMAEKVAETLVKIGTPAIEPLIVTLSDKDFHISMRAEKALGMIHVEVNDSMLRSHITDLLRTAVKDLSYGTQAMVIGLLGNLGDKGDVALLTPLLNESDPDVRKAAADALTKFGWKPKQNERKVDYLIAKRDWEGCIKAGAPAVQPLIDLLWDKEIGPEVEGALIKIGAPSVQPLIVVLANKDSHLRKTAADILGAIDDFHAVEALTTLLDDDDDEVSGAAIYALDRIDYKPGQDKAGNAYWTGKIKRLVEKLGDYPASWYERKNAAQELIKLYQSDLLSEAHKSLILAKRDTITRNHDDTSVHSETHGSASDCTYTDDSESHHDYGIGVPFPD